MAGNTSSALKLTSKRGREHEDHNTPLLMTAIRRAATIFSNPRHLPPPHASSIPPGAPLRAPGWNASFSPSTVAQRDDCHVWFRARDTAGFPRERTIFSFGAVERGRFNNTDDSRALDEGVRHSEAS